MFSTLVIGILGVSRLFHKLSVKEIAPKFLSKLVSLDQIFGKTENYESQVNNNSESKSMFDKMPIPALITVFIFAYLLTRTKFKPKRS